MPENKFYFLDAESEICYNKLYFTNYMNRNKLPKIEVYKAIPEIIGGGIFWCKKHSFCGDDSRQSCGKSNCQDYIPKNGISGACRHHTHWLYTHGEKVILKME